MKIYDETSLEGQVVRLEQEDSLIYMKLGFLGPEALKNAGGLPCEILPLFKGYFIAGTFNDIRSELHKLIDQACDANEAARKQND